MLRVLTRVTGLEKLQDAAAFLAALGGVRAGFRERAARVGELLRDPGTAFVLVTTAEAEPVEESIFLAGKLRAAHIPLAAVVINRMHHDGIAGFDVERLAGVMRAELGPSLARTVAENMREYHDRVEQDRAGERTLKRASIWAPSSKSRTSIEMSTTFRGSRAWAGFSSPTKPSASG